ncbi:guanine nucleotide-binding protein subunit alpha [Xylographa opegraphella]|nr:guanine nucleotide-binding protein subunit alpha [Xylographa opegraphella]
MSFSYTFEKDLQASPVYSRANKKHSSLSLPSSGARTTGWSVLSGISLSEVSNLSVFALPIFVNELYNHQVYANDLQRLLADGTAGNSSGPGSEIFPTFQILILGPTQSGKSTLFKQFQLRSGSSFELQNRKDAVQPIRALLGNSISDMHYCLASLANQSMSFGDGRSSALQATVLENRQCLKYDHSNFLRVIGAVKELWNEYLVQNFMITQTRMRHDNIAHYLYHAERIVKEPFVPSDLDILGLWTPSTGISSQLRMIEGDVYDVHDVAGVPSEQRKWINVSEAVDCVAFTVGLSGYNVDWWYGMNPLVDSLGLFESLIASKRFTNSAFFLIFTKIELFRKKLLHDPMKTYFPDYTGGSDLSNALVYWQSRFRHLMPHPCSQLHIQFAPSTASFQDNIMEMHDLMREELSRVRGRHGRHPLGGSTRDAWLKKAELIPEAETPQRSLYETATNVVPPDMRGMVTRSQASIEDIDLAL